VVVLDVEVQRCGTFSPTSADLLTLDISIVRLH